MKKIIYSLFILAAFVSLTAATNEAQKAFATVNQESGLYIFTDCKPNTDYTTIESITAKWVNLDIQSNTATGLSYDELKRDLFRQIAKKKKAGKLSEVNGIIIYPDRQTADLICIK